MKLQRSTGILLGVAIALVATVTLIETQNGDQNESGRTLYDFAEADVSEFRIERENTTLAFSNINNTWYIDEPESGPAEPSAIAFLLNILTSTPITETLTVKPDDLATFGLDAPTATIELTTFDQVEHNLTVGDADFSNTSLYVMKPKNETDNQSIEVHLISSDLENGLTRPTNEWILDDEENIDTSSDTSQ